MEELVKCAIGKISTYHILNYFSLVSFFVGSLIR